MRTRAARRRTDVRHVASLSRRTDYNNLHNVNDVRRELAESSASPTCTSSPSRIKTVSRASQEGSGASQPNLSVYVPGYKPSRVTVSRFAVSDGYRTATNAGLSPSFT